MHNKRLGRDDLLKIEVRDERPIFVKSLFAAHDFFQWARTPPSASWRFDSGREERGPPPRRRDRSPRRRSGSPPRRRDEYSPRKDDRRERDYDRRDRGDRSRSPDDRDREMKDVDRRRDLDDEPPNGDVKG